MLAHLGGWLAIESETYMDESEEIRLVLVHHLSRKREFLQQMSELLTEKFRANRITDPELLQIPALIRSHIRSFERLSEIEKSILRRSSHLGNALRRSYPNITELQVFVCTYIADGMDVAEMAETLSVQRRSIQKHLQNLRTLFNLPERMSIYGVRLHLESLVRNLDATETQPGQ